MFEPKVQKFYLQQSTHLKQSEQTAQHKQLTVSQKLDLEYLILCQVTFSSQFYQYTTRHLKIRIKKWLYKLDQLVLSLHWKEKRNQYAKTLYFMCQCEHLISPFDHLPTQKELPNLEPYQMRQIIQLMDRKVGEENKKERGCYDCWKKEKLAKERSNKRMLSQLKRVCKQQKVQKYRQKPQLNDSIETTAFTNNQGLTPFLSATRKEDTIALTVRQFKYSRHQLSPNRSKLPKFYEKRKEQLLKMKQASNRQYLSSQILHSCHKKHQTLTRGDLMVQSCRDTDENISVNKVKRTDYFKSTVQWQPTPIKPLLDLNM